MTSRPLQKSARIIAVVNQKGGVGKTTTAVNTGTALAQAGLTTLIIDLDPQGNASTGLGSLSSNRPTSTYDAMSGDRPLEDVIVTTPVENLFLAPGSVDLSGIDVELMSKSDRTTRLRRLVTGPDHDLRRGFDYILIDCPPSLNLLTLNALVASDSVIVPLQCEFFALEGLSQLLTTIRRIQGTLNPDLGIEGIVLTMYDRRNRLSAQVADDVRENLGNNVFETLIPRNVRLSEAPSHGLPSLVYDANCAGSQAYRELATELLRKHGRDIAA